MTMIGLIRKWNEIMGPKDERLEAEENKATNAAIPILFIGSILSMYYWMMVEQVARTAEAPVFTPLGESVFPVHFLLAATVLIAGIVYLGVLMRNGTISTRSRYAEVDRIPWGYVAATALLCGACLAVLTCGMRILAEIQIVGVENVLWIADIAVRMAFFAIGFVACFAVTALVIRNAIKRRLALEAELQD